MVWGASIAWYLFLAGASAGAFLTAAFIEEKYPHNRVMRLAGRIIAPIFVCVGLLLLMIDAEAGMKNPLRFAFLIMNPASVMTLGVYILCIFMPVSIVSGILEILKKTVPKWLTWIGIVSAFGVAIYTGFLLGVVKAYPLWNNSILPILFVVSALSAGLAATSLVGLLADRSGFERMWLVKKGHLVFLSLEAVLLVTMLIITWFANPDGTQSVSAMVSGKYAVLFWAGIILLGLVVPFCIEGYPVFITKKVETGVESLILSVVGEGGILIGSFLLRFLVISAALPVAFI